MQSQHPLQPRCAVENREKPNRRPFHHCAALGEQRRHYDQASPTVCRVRACAQRCALSLPRLWPKPGHTTLLMWRRLPRPSAPGPALHQRAAGGSPGVTARKASPRYKIISGPPFGDIMKRIAVLVLLIAVSVAWSVPTQAQRENRSIGENGIEARKAAKQQRKSVNKNAKRQRKLMKKYQKAQRKAAKQQQRRSR